MSTPPLPENLTLGPDWIPLARLLKPQGRKGELLAEPLSDIPDAFAPGRTFAIVPVGARGPAAGDSLSRLEQVWFPTGRNAGRVVLKLSSCDSISQAEMLSGKELLAPAEQLPALDPDTFLVRDLLGCELYDGAVRAGRIVDVQFATTPDGRRRLEEAAPLLAVARGLPEGSAADAVPEAEPSLVPFVRAWLESVDLSKRRIVMHLPPGLLGDA